MRENPSGDWVASGAGITLNGLAALPIAAVGWVLQVLSRGRLSTRNATGLAEARAELSRVVSEHQSGGYNSWVTRVGCMKHLEVVSEAGTLYQAEVQAFWDDKPGGAVRVTFSLDGGCVSAIVPLTESILVEADVVPPQQEHQ